MKDRFSELRENQKKSEEKLSQIEGMQICQGEKIGKIDENTKKVNEVYTQVEKIEQIQNENITIINI